MSSQSNKNTSVFLDGGLSHAEAQRGGAGGSTSVSTTIDRSTWKRVRLGDVCEISKGEQLNRTTLAEKGRIPVYNGGSAPSGYAEEANTDAENVIISEGGNSCGYVNYIHVPFWRGGHCYLLDTKLDKLLLYYVLKANESKIMSLRVGTGLPNIQRKRLNAFEFDLPIDTIKQRQIVSAFVSIDTHISALQSLIAKYEAIKKATVNLLLEPHKSIPVVKLGEVADISRGGSPRPIQDYLTSDSNGINWIKIGDVSVDAKYIERTEERIKPTGVAMSRQVKAGDFILSNSMSFGRPYILKIDGCIHDGWLAIQNYQNIFDVDYLYYLLGSDMVFTQYIENAAGSSVKNLNKEIVAKITLPSPPLSEQRKIAEKIIAIDNALADYKAQLEKARQLKAGMMSYFFG